MPIREDEVRRIARLAKLKIEEGELAGTAERFERILEYFGQLREIDTERVEPTFHAVTEGAGQTPMRDDEERQSPGTEDALANAPKKSEGHFQVPKVIE